MFMQKCMMSRLLQQNKIFYQEITFRDEPYEYESSRDYEEDVFNL